MNLKLSINMDSAAFDDYPGHELDKIFQNLASHCRNHLTAKVEGINIIRDSNGNRIGKWYFEGEWDD